jgi:hypothetical protein
METRALSLPFDEIEDEEKRVEVEDTADGDDVKENKNINPFAKRHGKTLSWRGVNMTVVSVCISCIAFEYT